MDRSSSTVLSPTVTSKSNSEPTTAPVLPSLSRCVESLCLPLPPQHTMLCCHVVAVMAAPHLNGNHDIHTKAGGVCNASAEDFRKNQPRPCHVVSANNVQWEKTFIEWRDGCGLSLDLLSLFWFMEDQVTGRLSQLGHWKGSVSFTHPLLMTEIKSGGLFLFFISRFLSSAGGQCSSGVQ